MGYHLATDFLVEGGLRARGMKLCQAKLILDIACMWWYAP